jgi:TatD DNase family protein
MLTDSHCHLDLLVADAVDPHAALAHVLDQANAHHVTRFLCAGIDLETYTNLRTLIDPFTSVSVSVGVHPNQQLAQEPTLDMLNHYIQDDRVVAIGETGLDYAYSDGHDPGWQRARFLLQIAAAQACQKPLIIHSRAAAADTIQLLKQSDAGTVGGVMHCFTEGWETAVQILDLGFYISFSGIVTFKNADALRQVAQKVPLDRLLIETDAPYLAPVPHRGHTNSPHFLPYTAAQLAQLRGLSVAEIAAITSANFLRLFPLAAVDPAPKNSAWKSETKASDRQSALFATDC